MKSYLKNLIPSRLRALLAAIKNEPNLIIRSIGTVRQYGLKKLQASLLLNDANEVNIPENDLFEDVLVVSEGLMTEPTLKIAIVIHAFHLDKISEIIRYIENIPYFYGLFFTVTKELKSDLEELLTEISIPYEIITTPNRGYDVSPFIELLPKLREENYDLVCKIHTKKGAANLEAHVNGIENIWFNLLIDPLLGSEQTVRKIINAFEMHETLGILGSADLYKSAQVLMYGNEKYTGKLINILKNGVDPAQEWGFFAGSMFWARLDVFQPVIDNNNQLSTYLHENVAMQTGAIDSVFHAMERVFGLLPSITNMKSALSYAIDFNRTSHNIQILSDTAEHFSPIGVGTSLHNEYNLAKNYQILHDSDGSEFNTSYYLKQVPCSQLGMDPLLHFLRYGVYQNKVPSEDFSPTAYWSVNLDVYHHRMNSLVHFVEKGKFEHNRIVFPDPLNNVKIKEIILKSELFDQNYYLQENPDVARSHMDPCDHYCRYGWQESRSPSAEFNVNWYQSEYLNEFLAPVNPLLHFILVGNNRGFKPRPVFKGKPGIQVEKFPEDPKRICLFAAYDPDGLIDESDILFVKELARHADVYFLSDSNLEAGELDKLNDYVKGGWGIRHGGYDFGSYMRLAKFLVGWDVIAKYDEVLLVNDSSYLIRSLDDVFDKMNKKSCAWWGLQATKGMTATMMQKSNCFSHKIPMTKVKNYLLMHYDNETPYDFHVGSYFLAFRKPVMDGGELKKILDNVKQEHSKKNIILKYEMGLTQKLINSGYDFDTLMDDLYPFHPLYTNHVFAMIKEGFPLFKRFFLTENHYFVPDLWQWKEKLVTLLPGLDVTPFEKNLYRISDAEKLNNNLHIKEPEPLLNNREFVKEDKKIVKNPNYWAFPVCAFDHTFSGNERAVFEAVKNNPEIKKIILYKSKKIEVDGLNVELVSLHSRKGQEALLQSGIIFIKHTPKANAVYPLNGNLHKFINLWHGIPLKRIGMASRDLQSKKRTVMAEHKKCHCVIASSAIDRMAMASALYPLTYSDVWVTGLPRNDFILREENKLPDDFQLQLQILDKILNGRKLVLFAPTFRNDQSDAYYRFSGEEKKALLTVLAAENAVLGVREHMADRANSYRHDLQNSLVMDLGSAQFPNIEVLYRRAEVLITDYSSCFIDFMLTGKPMISFAYDYENYMNKERGFFYDQKDVFPGPVCYDFEALRLALISTFSVHRSEDTPVLSKDYLFKRKLFFDYIDDKNAARLVAKIKIEAETGKNK